MHKICSRNSYGRAEIRSEWAQNIIIGAALNRIEIRVSKVSIAYSLHQQMNATMRFAKVKRPNFDQLYNTFIYLNIQALKKYTQI